MAFAEKWHAARRVLRKINENAPDYPDEEGLEALVEENIAALERQEKVETLYRQALIQIDEGDLEAARRSLSNLQEIQPGYAESERLLGKIESEIEHHAEERQLEPAWQASQPEAAASGPRSADPAWCPVHNCQMTRKEKNGDVWYSHKAPDGSWCRGGEK